MSANLKNEDGIVIDEVMAEVHRVKEGLMERWNYDMDAMIQDARARQARSGHSVVMAPTEEGRLSRTSLLS
jgi:hypothetical protein